MTIDSSKNCIYLHSKENRTEKWTRYDTNDKKKSYRLIQEDQKTSTQTSTRKQKLQTQDKRTDSETMSQKVDKQEDKYRNFVPERHLESPDTKKPSSCASLLGWQDVPHLARKNGPRATNTHTVLHSPPKGALVPYLNL